MQFIKKSFITAAIAFVSAVGLVACGSGANEATTNADGAIKVKFWHSSGGANGKALDELVAEFNESQKGKIEIDASYQGDYGTAISKFISSVQTNDLPVLMQASDVQTAFMRDSGLVTPAYELNEKDGNSYDFDGLMPLAKNYYSFNGEVYSMPVMVSQPALYVNDDLLEQAGVTHEDLATVTGFVDAINKIHEATGVAGLTFHHSGWYIEETNAMLGELTCTPENGGGATPADNFNLTNDNLVRLWTDFGNMYASGALHNPGNDSSAATGAFLAGDAAMQMNSSGGYGNVANADVPFNWSILPLPRANDQSGAVPGGNSFWVINQGHTEEEQMAAWEFMKFLGSDEVQVKIFNETGYLPTTQKAASMLTDLQPQQQALIDQVSSTPISPVTAGCKSGALNAARAPYEAAMTSIANGKDAAQAFQTAQDEDARTISSYNVRAQYTANK